MSYKLTWHVVEEVLRLDLYNSVSVDELKHINQRVAELLDEAKRRLTLLIEVSNLKVGYATADQLKNTQHYRDHRNLDTIIVVADNKLNRLITLLAFNLSRARFVQFDSGDKAQTYMLQRGISGAATMMYNGGAESTSNNAC